MTNTTYFLGIIKLIDKPKQIFLETNTLVTIFPGEISQVPSNKIIQVNFWGNLAKQVKRYYKINDYVLIEGYLTFMAKPKNSVGKINSCLILTGLKVYPFLLK